MKNIKLLVILIIYIFVDIYLSINNATIFTNVINPIFFSVITCYCILNIKKIYIRTSDNRENLFFMHLFLLIHIIMFFYTGLIIGFCKNPYSQELTQLVKNIIIQIVPIIGLELTRYILISRNKNNKNLLIIVTLVLILLRIDYKVVVNLLKIQKNLAQ